MTYQTAIGQKRTLESAGIKLFGLKYTVHLRLGCYGGQ